MPEPRPIDHVLQTEMQAVREQALAWRLSLQYSSKDRARHPGSSPDYAELMCLSNFSFLNGASHAHELVEQAHTLGYDALAITDECSVAGSVRAHTALQEHVAALSNNNDCAGTEPERPPFKLIHGASFVLRHEEPQRSGTLVCWVPHRSAWQGLCRFISTARRAAPKGQYDIHATNLPWASLSSCLMMWLPQRHTVVNLTTSAQAIAQAAQNVWQRIWAAGAPTENQCFLGLHLGLLSGDDIWKSCLELASEHANAALVATGDVRMHVRTRKPLHDVLTATRLGLTVHACGTHLQANAEAHLRRRKSLQRIYPSELLARTVSIAQRCHFSLDELRYDYPQETVPSGLTPLQALTQLSWAGAHTRYPQGVPERVGQSLHKELALIAECRYEMFFLTVEDVVRFARSQGILCQGRGSAANSTVCFCLGITAVDPMHASLLLERFISKERINEPPDIDVDFEHQRREEVIQYIYRKYGRERAALAATVISYRARSAIRDVGKALALPEKLIDAFAKDHHWFDRGLQSDELTQWCERAGVANDDARLPQWLALTREIMGFPRHLSQHVGGFVLTQSPLCEMVPIENASMPERTVIQWDKDDLESLGMLKVDVLALGMLSAVARCLVLRNRWHNSAWGLADVPQEDDATYAMLRAADTLGTFQVESRAQQSMLPRLKPRTFYDLVVQVAIVRPGPIQGGMVHPYLKARERQRQGLAEVYEKDDLKPALERTLGVPIFQEQVMQISMIAAGFSAAQADALRRSMAAWKKKGGVHKFYEPIINGMASRGYSHEFAERIFSQILGFGEYGFPESHAYSFALIAYVSCWLKCHEPACFLAAMLNSQPLGFYSPSQLVQDAQRHGVQVFSADVNQSDWDCSMPERMSVRLGLCMVGSLSQAAGTRIQAERQQGGPFASVQQLSLRAALDVGDINALAAADALHSLAGHRRQQIWEAAARVRAPALLREAPIDEPALDLPAAPLGEEVLWDHASMGLSLRAHPLALLRTRLDKQRIKGLPLASSTQLRGFAHGVRVVTVGLVTVRQQPQTAKGTLFITLEDEFGATNVVVWRHIRERQRHTVVHARLLAVLGRWERETEFSQGSVDQVCHLIAHELIDLTDWLGRFNEIKQRSRDFH